MAGWCVVGTAAKTSFNYAEDAKDWAGYVEFNCGGPPGSGPFRVDNNGHIQVTQGLTALTAVAGGNAGTSPPVPVVPVGTNDAAGTITFGTGTGPSAGVLVAVTFAVPWVVPGGGAPHLIVQPINSATQALGIFHSGVSPTGFNLSSANAPAAGQGNTVYQFSYHCIG